jgi:hypothetical protein
MEISKYIHKIGEIPNKVQEFEYKPTISEMIERKEIYPTIEKEIKGQIILILGTYLPLNVKGKSITSKEAINLLTEQIINDFPNLEIQEIEFIIKNGILGKFGVIYNDISLDTILGKDGWFEMYYKQYRTLRPEPQKQIKIQYTGKEMSKDQFYQKNPEYALKAKVSEIKALAKNRTINQAYINDWYNLQGIKQSQIEREKEDIRKDYQSSGLAEFTTFLDFYKECMIKRILNS